MGTSRRTQPVDAEMARFDYIKTEELKFRNPIIGELVKGLLWIGVDRPAFAWLRNPDFLRMPSNLFFKITHQLQVVMRIADSNGKGELTFQARVAPNA
jgi:hypothetical protein